jgi:hypothetical protein
MTCSDTDSVTKPGSSATTSDSSSSEHQCCGECFDECRCSAATTGSGSYFQCGGSSTYPQVMRHTTLASFYQDKTMDPLCKRYVTVITQFDTMVDTPQTAAALLDMAVGNPSIPSTFLCCAAIHGNKRHRIYLLHTPSKYTPWMDGRVTPWWDNRIFCFLGDLLGDSAVTVTISTTAFNALQCTVYNEARLALELPNLNGNELFPCCTGVQDAIVMQTRHLMYPPSKCAPLLLNNRGYAIKEAWNILSQAF